MPKRRIQKSKNFREAEDFLKINFSSPTHWPDWNLLVSKHYDSDFYYYFAREGDELIGICPIHKGGNGILRNLYSGQYHYLPYGGWIFSKKTLFKKSKFRLNQFTNFQAFCLPSISNFKVEYLSKEINKVFKTIVLDLSLGYDHIYNNNFNNRVKRNIKNAKKNNLKLRHNNDVLNFYKYYLEACSKQGLSCLSEDFFSDLLNTIHNIQVDFLWAIKGDTILGYLVIISDKDYSLFWLSHVIEGSELLGQGQFLHSEAIKFSINNGCKYYDLCYIEKERLPGIYEFKRGFSKNEVEVPLITQKPLAYKVINRINRCF